MTVCSELRHAEHSGCFACAEAGLGLQFEVVSPGCVEGRFVCPDGFQSYDGMLHGGIICLLLDAAMTNCGFSMGRTMVTGDLQVRFLHPVPTGEAVVVRASADDCSGVLQVVRAEIRWNDRLMARAVGKFVDKGQVTTADCRPETGGLRNPCGLCWRIAPKKRVR